MQDKMIGEKEHPEMEILQEVHKITEDIIDEETGKKIGEKIISTINPIKTQPDDANAMTPTIKDGKNFFLKYIYIFKKIVNGSTAKNQWSTPKQPKLRDVMQKAMGRMRSAGRNQREVTPFETPNTSTTIEEGMEKTEMLTENGKPMIRFMNFTSNLSALEEHDTTDITNTTKEGSPASQIHTQG